MIKSVNENGPDYGAPYLPDINPTVPNPEATNSQDQPFDVDNWMAEILAEPGPKIEEQDLGQLATTIGSQEESFDVEDWTAEMLREPAVPNTEMQEEPSQSTTTAPQQEESFDHAAWMAEMFEERDREIEELERKELALKSIVDSKFHDTSDTLPQSNQVPFASGMEKEEVISKPTPTLADEGWIPMSTGSARQEEASSDDWLKHIVDCDYIDRG